MPAAAPTDAPPAADKPADTAKPADVPATGDETPLALVLGRKKRTEK